jgi:hypothetical protein
MKGKILLVFLTISGLLINASSTLAKTALPSNNLSNTIATLVDLDAENQKLVKSAINRVLAAKQKAKVIKQTPRNNSKKDPKQLITNDDYMLLGSALPIEPQQRTTTRNVGTIRQKQSE